MVPVVHADRRARLVVRGHVRQLVVLAERLAGAGRADAAGDVQLLADDVLPDRVDGLHVGRVAGERRDVGHARIHVGRAHGVADRLGLLDDALLRLVVLEAARVGLLTGLRAALVEHELRELEIALVAGDAIELDEAHLGDLVARPDRSLARDRTCGRAGPRSSSRCRAACACRSPDSARRRPRRGDRGCTARGCRHARAPSAPCRPTDAGAAGSIVRVV